MHLEQKKRTIHLMGTIIELMVEHKQAEKVLSKSVELLKIYEHRFSANDPKSELMSINLRAGIKAVSVHPELFNLIKIGKKHSVDPNSRLNIAVGPLVQTWRIGFKDARVPNADEIKNKLKLTDPTQIILNERDTSVFLRKSGMLIDLGALAKGYIADLMLEYWKNCGVKSALINLGGNIVVYGDAPNREDGLWRIGIRDPNSDVESYQLILPIRERSVVTSGIYERSLSVGDKQYHHILDTKTGYPAHTDVSSLTIISNNSIDGEIWTTRLFGESPNEIMATINQLPEIEGIMIKKNNEVLYSDQLETELSLNA